MTKKHVIAKKNQTEHWDRFYDGKLSTMSSPMPPSQFAAFTVAELVDEKVDVIFDIAAGDFRDSIFFMEQGF